MRLLVSVIDPIPSYINKSYGDFGFYKLGVMVWTYDGYDGEVEFINRKKFVSEPKYPNPTNYTVWMQKNVLYTVQLVPTIRTDIADQVIAGITANLLSGKGFPVPFPY